MIDKVKCKYFNENHQLFLKFKVQEFRFQNFMRNTELEYAMAITLLDGVGNINAKKLLAYCGSFENVFSTPKGKLAKIPGIGEVLSNKIFVQITKGDYKKRVKEELNFIKSNDISTYLITDKSYPLNLKQCEDSPIVLYGKGNIDFNNHKTIAIVGTRKVTQRGKDFCEKLLEELMANGAQIIFCGQSSYSRDFPKADLINGVQLSLSAMTALIQLQDVNYRLIKF